MVNAYGPTEASDDITHFLIKKAFDVSRIPIGKPIQNLNIYIVDKKMKPIDAMKRSYEITTGSFWPIFVFFLVLTAISFVGSIPAGLGLLVVIPVSMIAAAYVYRKLEGASESGPPAVEEVMTA